MLIFTTKIIINSMKKCLQIIKILVIKNLKTLLQYIKNNQLQTVHLSVFAK